MSPPSKASDGNWQPVGYAKGKEHKALKLGSSSATSVDMLHEAVVEHNTSHVIKTLILDPDLSESDGAGTSFENKFKQENEEEQQQKASEVSGVHFGLQQSSDAAEGNFTAEVLEKKLVSHSQCNCLICQHVLSNRLQKILTQAQGM